MAAWMERYHDSLWTYVYQTKDGNLCFRNKPTMALHGPEIDGARLIGVAKRQLNENGEISIELIHTMDKPLKQLSVKIL